MPNRYSPSRMSGYRIEGPVELEAERQTWPLREPFRVANYVAHAFEVIHVRASASGHIGLGEGYGVRYLGENAESLLAQVDAVRDLIRVGVSHSELQNLLPAGGARNAVDCALWDLAAKSTGVPVWLLAGLRHPQPLRTAFGCGTDEPEKMAAAATAWPHAKVIKLKLTGESSDADRVTAVRRARPDVELLVDANQSLSPSLLDELLPTLERAQVSLIEQPFPVGQEQLFDDFRDRIPFAADESVQTFHDIPKVQGRVHYVNIKLDKCGGLTSALNMVPEVLKHGLKPMIGCMGSTSLGIAPAYLVGQICNFVDLDSPLFLASDQFPSTDYASGELVCPPSLWGYPEQDQECLK